MRDEWGSTGPPNENTRIPLLEKVRNLILQDECLTQGNHLVGFSQRQAAQGFRQSVMLQRPPEVNVGKLMDIGS